MTNAQIRTLMQRYMFTTVSDQAKHSNWVYEFSRALPVVPIGYTPSVKILADCSFGCKLICHAAGVPDPTGYNYLGYGNSGSIWHHLPKITLSEAKPGDIVTFGFEGDHHAAMLYMWHDNHCWLWNHGRQGQPVFSTLGAETAYHSGMDVQWCQVLRPDPPQHSRGNPPVKKGHP